MIARERTLRIPAPKRRALCRLIEAEIRCLDSSHTWFSDGRIHDREAIRERAHWVWLLKELGGGSLPFNTYAPAHLRRKA